MGELLIGTSGYDYDTWKGGFYPEKLAKTKFLEFYSQQFNSVEINGTYYRPPTSQQMERMKERSSGRLKFTIKANKEITHALDKSQYQPLVASFKTALEPLINDKLLLCVLVQFPESFHYEPDERIYLDLLLKEMKDIPVVVEFRNSKWQNDIVYNALRKRGVGWCITDEPKLKNLMKLDYVMTSDICYMRFHGRNAKNWYSGNNETRYEYLYSDDELREFVEPIKYLLQRARVVQLFFNNHAKSYATINAKKIELLLRE